MKAINPSKERTQSVHEALSLIQTAQKEGCPVRVTKAGNLEILFQKVDTKKPTVLNEVAVKALLKKINQESQSYVLSENGISLQKLMERIPELKKPKETIHVETLSQQWRSWKSGVEDIKIATEKALLENRNRVIDAMSAVLPAELEWSNMDGYIATLSRPFSKDAQQGILEDLLKLNLSEPDPKQQFDPQFIKDAHRANFSFEANGQIFQYPRGDKEKVPKALTQCTNNNPVIAGTLSKLINQGTFALLLMAEVDDLPTESGGLFGVMQGVAEGSTEDSEAVQYKLSKQDNGDFIVSCICLKKGVSVTSAYSGQIWPINHGKIWEGPPSQNNFAVRHTLTMRLKHEHLEEGVIIPEFLQPPTVSWCISPDFESIDKDYISSTKDL